jgi:hypothetical protein
MIDVKQAVERATLKAQELYKGQILEELNLEEVEITDDERYWLITLGFFLRHTGPVRKGKVLQTIVEGRLADRQERNYKLFKVDAATGEVRAMKIRKP